MELLDKIRSRKARTGVIGLGYVGLPLAHRVRARGFPGRRHRRRPAQSRRRQRRPVVHRRHRRRGDRVAGRRPDASSPPTTSASSPSCDTINICVPTPLRKTKDPDMTFILAAVAEIKKYLHPGQLVILESTTYPGTTDEVVLPALEEVGLEGRPGFLPRVLSRAHRSRQQAVSDPQHPEGRRRRDRAAARRSRRRSTSRASTRWCRSRRRGSPRW